MEDGHVETESLKHLGVSMKKNSSVANDYKTSLPGPVPGQISIFNSTRISKKD